MLDQTFDEPTWIVAPRYYDATVRQVDYSTVQHLPASVSDQWVTVRLLVDGSWPFVLGFLG